MPVTVKNYSPNDLRFQLVENMAKYPHCYFVSLPIHFTDIFNSFCSYTVFIYVIIPVINLYLYFNYAPTLILEICENYIAGYRLYIIQKVSPEPVRSRQ